MNLTLIVQGVCNCNTGKIDCQGRPAGGGGNCLHQFVINIVIILVFNIVIIIFVINIVIFLVIKIVIMIIFFIIMYHHTDQVLEEEEGEKDEGRAEASLKENTRKETRPRAQTKHSS